jgi:hypothetical protein
MIDLNKNPNAPFEKFSTTVDNKTPILPPIQSNPIPILVFYVDISNIEYDEIIDLLDNTSETLNYYKQFGWESLIIPSKLPTKLECISVNNMDLIEFEKFKTEILAKYE